MFDLKTSKVAIVGAGYMAREHIIAFQDLPGVEIVGIHSRTKSKAEALAVEFNVTSICESIQELYEICKAEIVVISVPELSTREVCFEAFKYPWISLIEKPAGYDLDEAKLISEEARLKNRSAYVALNRRHYSSTRALLAEIAIIAGKRLIHVYDQQDQQSALKAGQPELVVKNWMYANSIHLVDYLSFLGRGNIVSIKPLIPWKPSNPEFVAAQIFFESGDIAFYEAVWNGPGPWAVSVTTSEKRWELRPLEQVYVQVNGSRKQDPIDQNDFDKKFKPGLRIQAEETIKALRGEAHFLPSLEDALKSMELVNAIYGKGF